MIFVIAVVLVLPIVVVLLISYRRSLNYPEKRFMNSFLDTILQPLRWLHLGPFHEGELTIPKAMKKAMKATNLTDFGDLSFAKVYETASGYPSHKALRLSNVGYLMYQIELQSTMEKRLKMMDYYKKHPDVLKIPFRAPVFVLGLPRTGTTFLHRLLSLDPTVRSPFLWEHMNPTPSPTLSTQEEFDKDREKRAQFVRDQMQLRDFLGDDSLQHLHELSADLPEECLFALAEELPLHLSYLYSVYLNFYPFMKTIMNTERARFAYLHYKKQLQMLNYQIISQRANPPRWVLKCPLHLFYINEIFELFPDAKIIW